MKHLIVTLSILLSACAQSGNESKQSATGDNEAGACYGLNQVGSFHSMGPNGPSGMPFDQYRVTDACTLESNNCGYRIEFTRPDALTSETFVTVNESTPNIPNCLAPGQYTCRLEYRATYDAVVLSCPGIQSELYTSDSN